eukprot:TRINITY_DN1990_c0_g1_i3.p2 TRINITY_DN1990_c0_g1~~TRINITY_DN1990_c0_g1_i3.p2  ORF type:complete len:133 (+),score=34.87 TRINITY_DN1990_c0_g1_i3:331-729(+)
MCPMCRNEISRGEIAQDNMAYNLIGEIEVHCNNAGNGCMWDGTIAELAEHLAECVYSSSRMPKWLKEHLGARVALSQPLGERKAKRVKAEKSCRRDPKELIDMPEVKREVRKAKRKSERVANNKRKRNSNAH